MYWPPRQPSGRATHQRNLTRGAGHHELRRQQSTGCHPYPFRVPLGHSALASPTIAFNLLHSRRPASALVTNRHARPRVVLAATASAR
jgi:hypothetical protein